MAKLIKFPAPKIVPELTPAPQLKSAGQGRSVRSNRLVKVIWTVTVLIWPLLRYVFILDCVFQLFRMLWFWNTPGTFAGFNFLLHFAVLVWFTWFVSLYQPKDF
jgi:hypothetical protein